MAGRKWMRHLPHSVYVLFNEYDDALYVGLAVTPEHRILKHRTRDWLPEVTHVSIEVYPDWENAKHIEGVRIAELEPTHNKRREEWAAAHLPSNPRAPIQHWEGVMNHG